MGLFARQVGGAVIPILASTKCDYKVPLTYPDEVLVTATTFKIGRTSFTQAYEIKSVTKNALAAQGEGTIVCVDAKTGKPVEGPEEMRKAIERVESTASAPR